MDFLEKNEVGIFYGNDSSAKPVIESHSIVLEKKDTTLMGSGYIFQSMNSTVTMNLSVIFKLKGVNMTISAACARVRMLWAGILLYTKGLQVYFVCGGAKKPTTFQWEV
jgi:3-oxoacyl-[acyl-carrier-protein] synthase-1